MRRDHFAEDETMQGWTQAQHAAQIKSTYESIQAEIYGPDFRAEALKLEPIVPPENVVAENIPVEDFVATDGAEADARLDPGRPVTGDIPTISSGQPTAVQYLLATPRNSPRPHQASSPGFLLFQSNTRRSSIMTPGTRQK